jgi:hypothetical protein
MSKKFGINTKSADARAKKDAVKQANDRDKQQKLEDEYWRDDDKQVQKKQQRKVFKKQILLQIYLILILFQEERDQKDNEKLQRKQEIQKLLEQEEATLAASKAKAKPDLVPKKVTQAQIQQRQTTVAAAANVTEPKRNNVNNQEDLPLEDNINRLQIDGSSARNVDEAIHVLQ